MLFRRILIAAFAVSIVTGLAFALGQHFQVSQLIYAAEAFEGGGAAEAAHQHASAEHVAEHGHHHGENEAAAGHGHGHGGDAWAPADGGERIFFTALSDIFVALAFSVLMLVTMSAAYLYRGTTVGPVRGLAWGAAGFAVFFAAPSFGLPPELPGMQAAGLQARQLWWIATVACTAGALGLFGFARGWKKAPGIVLLAIPHLVGAPHPHGGAFAGMGPDTVAAMGELHQQFIAATAVTNAAFWLLLGLACGWAVQNWVLRDVRNAA